MKMNALIPMVPVKSMPTSVEFYGKLGFTVEHRNDDWRWAMLRFDECRLMLDESIDAHPALPRTQVLYLYPDDVRRYHAQVRAAGVEVPELETAFYGMREFRLADPDGNRFAVGELSTPA